MLREVDTHSYTATHCVRFVQRANANFQVNDCRWLCYTQATMVMTMMTSTTTTMTKVMAARAATAAVMIIVNDMLLIVHFSVSFHFIVLRQFNSFLQVRNTIDTKALPAKNK